MLVLDAIRRVFTLKILNLDRPNVRHKNVTRQTGQTKHTNKMAGRLEQTERQTDMPLNSGIGKEAGLASVCGGIIICRLVMMFQKESTRSKIWRNMKLLSNLWQTAEKLVLKSMKIDL